MEDDKKRPFKAMMSALVAGLGTAYTALADNGVTAQEGVGIALSVVIGFGAVYGIKNPKV